MKKVRTCWKYVLGRGYDPQQIVRNQWVNKAAKSLNIASSEELFTSISYGGVLLSKVFSLLQTYYHEEKQQEIKRKEKEQELLEGKRRTKEPPQNGVTIEGMDDLLVRVCKMLATPVPGDEIIGFITKRQRNFHPSERLYQHIIFAGRGQTALYQSGMEPEKGERFLRCGCTTAG